MASLTFRAAVLRQAGQAPAIEPVQLVQFAPTDVLVRVEAAAVTGADVAAADGVEAWPQPIVLGREVAGTVARLGDAVGHLRLGDRVVLHGNPHCGRCYYCLGEQPALCEVYNAGLRQGLPLDGMPRLALDGAPLHQAGYVGGFAEYCVVDGPCAVAVPEDLPTQVACLLGGAVLRGFGAATRAAGIDWGVTVAVLGCGAVGLAAVQGARLRGAGALLAVDRDPQRCEIAAVLGATEICDAAYDDPVATVRGLTTGRGADVVIAAADGAEALTTALDMARAGGTVVWLGDLAPQETVAFTGASLLPERRILRVTDGGGRPQREIPRLARACLDGTLDLSPLVTHRLGFDGIAAGIDRKRGGLAIRPVLQLT
jgi:S-(hydroxymethyl)glutathione dehydrogenase/alcohol dehydrogenase